MKTPTAAPAVPGAFGMKPAPPAEAIPIAIQSSGVSGPLVFATSIETVKLFGRFFFGGYAVLFACPVAKVDEFATFTAERTIRISFELDFFVTNRTLHCTVER